MELFALFLANGIVTGSVYTLLAIGLSLMLSIMRIVNFAHGEVYMVGAYAAWLVVTRFIPNYWVGFLVAVAIGGLLGFILERICFRPIYTGPGVSQFIVSLALVIFLQEVIFISFTGLLQTLPAPYITVRNIGNFAITDQRLLLIGITLIILVTVLLFFKRTKLGKAMRAAAGNKLAAALVGIKVNRMSSFAFIGGGALAAVAGVLVAGIHTINPFMGARLISIAFVVVVTGGMGSIGGAAIAGYSIGIIEGLFSGYITTKWAFAVPFVILVLVLKFRPMGLFGKEPAG